MDLDSFIIGYTPEIKIEPGNPEAAKYAKLYDIPEYRKGAPGEIYCQVFLNQIKPKPGSTIIDCGSGTGRGAVILALLGGLKVTMIDFVRNGLDQRVRELMEELKAERPDTVCSCRLSYSPTSMTTLRPARADCPMCKGSGKVKAAERFGSLDFVKHDMEKPFPVVAEYVFCGDVMEHIPPAKVDDVLNNILMSAQNCWFTIAMFDELHGPELIGEHLHISLHPFEWWEQKFKDRDCEITYARNQDDHYAHFFVKAWRNATEIVDHGVLNTDEQKIMENVRFNTRKVWVLAKDGKQRPEEFETEELAWSKVYEGWTPVLVPKWNQITPFVQNDMEVMILGGGYSLNQFVDEIKKNYEDGVKLVTLNGSYNWAIGHGMAPSAQMIVDARPFNSRFTKPVVPVKYQLRGEDWSYATHADKIMRFDTKEEAKAAIVNFPRHVIEEIGCKYLIASQVDPTVLEGLPKERTFLWHTMAEHIRDILDNRYGTRAGTICGCRIKEGYIPENELEEPKSDCTFCSGSGIVNGSIGRWYGVPGGSTVLLRAIPLLRMLGYHKFILYGCDSCVAEDRHHAYEQPENDKPYVMPIAVNPGGHIFMCTSSHVSQAQEFMDTIKYIGDDIDLDVKGDGLLAHILKVAADLEDLDKIKLDALMPVQQSMEEFEDRKPKE